MLKQCKGLRRWERVVLCNAPGDACMCLKSLLDSKTQHGRLYYSLTGLYDCIRTISFLAATASFLVVTTWWTMSRWAVSFFWGTFMCCRSLMRKWTLSFKWMKRMHFIMQSENVSGYGPRFCLNAGSVSLTVSTPSPHHGLQHHSITPPVFPTWQTSDCLFPAARWSSSWRGCTRTSLLKTCV